jgi:PAS domain S-box-containing protein
VDKNPVTILVVDDNPATLYSTSRFLKAAGFTTVEAANGEEALARAGEGVDVVVLDVNLPDIDGFEVCRRLRAREETSRMPIIHLSATFAADADKVHGLNAGADGYLTHPVEPPVLIATVNAFLRARQAEEGMRRSEQRFRTIFDQASNGITLITDGFVYVEVNPAMCRMLGRSRAEVVGKHVSAFLPREEEERIATLIRNVESGGQWRGTLPHLHASGRTVELDWHVSAHSAPGLHLAMVGDVTERRAFDAERERLLASERAARADAERANRLKDEFLATLSHELRTPLNAIVGWAQILQTATVSAEDVREAAESIERNANAQASLISDLLDVSRITSGKLRLDVERVDPVSLIRTAMDAISPDAIAKGVVIDQDLDRNTGPVAADPKRLRQVVWNLMNNAVKFTPPGGEVTVRLRRKGEDVEIVVSDTGQGIGPEFLPYLFERFRQEDGSTRRNHGGLGLGLAIVRHLVEMHGGTVRAESAGEGKGSTFTVRLPARAETGADGGGTEPGSPVPPAAVRLPRSALAGVRVIVVDDDPDARAMVRRVLVEFGATVAEAGGVDEALALLEGPRPAVLVSDIGMPRRDGYDLIRAARAGGHPPEVLPAIALTAFAREDDRDRALGAGFQAHLAKPINTSRLVETIARLTGRLVT